ncbi:hypothetical protein QAD02_006306 [Eretmocerus hayati]|uniref:Uncharacterized protein n=1 Tax=Eretmocerus hayati TaxID=131215 RepID=A0ACC2N0K2_9HYME|nr:hypothetical protein QAD02_006306 [Eretmocerus hayati]
MAIKKIILYISIALLTLMYAPGIPPYVNFSAYRTGELSGSVVLQRLRKDDLNNAEILFEGKIKGPEAFASYNGELYTGAVDGYVYRIDKDQLVRIVKFGDHCEPAWNDPRCGRPLGMKFDAKGNLYVCDAYNGIFKVDVKSQKFEIIEDSERPIEGKTPKLFNSLDIDSNGNIYWTDFSSDFSLKDIFFAMLADPSGRVILYNSTTKVNKVLISGIFANGIALSENEDFVIILDTLASRIIKYNIKGPKSGTHEVLIDNLPGSPDNVHPDGHGGFLIPLVKTSKSAEILRSYPRLRRLLARIIYLLQLPLKWIQSYAPNILSKWLLYYVGNFETFSFLLEKIVTVIRIDETGRIIESVSNSDGKIFLMSSTYVHDEFLWFGSPAMEFIARVPLDQAFPSLGLGTDYEKFYDVKR